MAAAPSFVDVLRDKGVVVLAEVCKPNLHASICLGSSPETGGRGLYAKHRIGKGELIWMEAKGMDPVPRTYAQIAELPEEARTVFLHFSYCKCISVHC